MTLIGGQTCAEAEHPYYSDIALTATRESHSQLFEFNIFIEHK